MGRIGKLQKPLSLHDCIALLKKYLKLDHIRFAQGVSHTLDSQVSSVAVCAGSGSSILKDVDADLYITGEMSHHELLHANHRNVSVILCEHSNTERGYLKKLISDLSSKLPNVNLVMSSMDKDPVTIL
ncbi:NIF3-like protein 1 [Stegodyphus dumicola]|uniref:NIF3-like protein 1 n=1 Tax=Stegodyphus dumicola TaxID=202533 RepID=UPI0015A98DF7|nr:NIF3-like protein 1 [Stegodyphus dumicola]